MSYTRPTKPIFDKKGLREILIAYAGICAFITVAICLETPRPPLVNIIGLTFLSFLVMGLIVGPIAGMIVLGFKMAQRAYAADLARYQGGRVTIRAYAYGTNDSIWRHADRILREDHEARAMAADIETDVAAGYTGVLIDMQGIAAVKRSFIAVLHAHLSAHTLALATFTFTGPSLADEEAARLWRYEAGPPDEETARRWVAEISQEQL